MGAGVYSSDLWQAHRSLWLCLGGSGPFPPSQLHHWIYPWWLHGFDSCCINMLQLVSILEEDEFARNYQLASKLQKVHLLMRVRVWIQLIVIWCSSKSDICFAQRPDCGERQLAITFRAPVVVICLTVGWYQCLTVDINVPWTMTLFFRAVTDDAAE